jgi:hypothetical protein
MSSVQRLWRPLTTTALSLWLLGCGGGGGDSTPPPPPASITLSGVAATGLPLIGTVTLKDARGVTRSTAIGVNGSYAIDTSGLTAPLVLRAEGSVSGQRYVIHSATSSADTSATLNITPLTDLIVANVAGQVAQRYFDNGNFAGLTRAEIDTESAALKARLLPVLQAMQVDAAIDLMRTPFTPLSSALDQALDVIRVSLDPIANRATITNLINQLAIVDDLAVRAAAEGAVPPLPATGMSTAAADLLAVRQSMTDFFALFRTTLPAAGAVSAKLTADFLFDGRLRDGFSQDIAGNTELLGVSVRNIDVQSIDYAAAIGPVATLRLEFLTATGQPDGHQEGWQVVRGQDGIWRWRGNQSLIEFSGGVHAVKNTNGCLATGYEFNLYDSGNAALATVAQLRVTGPGLPADGMRYRRSAGGQQWEYYNGGANNPYFYRLTAVNCGGNLGAGIPDATIATIPDNAAYTLQAFDAQGGAVSLGGNGTQTKTLARRSFTLAEAQAAVFPTITTSSPFGSYNGGALTISGTGASPNLPVWVYLGGVTASGGVSTDQNVPASASGAYSSTLTLTTGSYSYREIRVATHDAFDRTLLSNLTP